MFANLSIVGNSKCQIDHLICFISILSKIMDIVNNMCVKQITLNVNIIYNFSKYQNNTDKRSIVVTRRH